VTNKLLRMLRSVGRLLPARLPEIVYTVFLRPPPLRRAANWFLLKIIPPEVVIDGVTLYLNPSDPVLSPAVALGVYENYELEAFRSYCSPGAIVVDIGANVGLYTASAAARVGKEGLVIAIEPHPESYRYLKRTVEKNCLSVKSFEVAAGDSRRLTPLFLTDENKADSRIYNGDGRRRETMVQMVSLDALLADNGIGKVNVIKMDVQGAEALVLSGMRRTLANSANVVMFTEFWPWGIEQAGQSPLDFLRDLQKLGFRFKTIDESDRRITDVAEISDLVADHDKLQYTGADLRRSHANLICIKGDAPDLLDRDLPNSRG
jgi:FkbM family methyltransferase